MASSSQFAYSIHQRRHELLSELVSNVLQVTPDDENYGLALDYCLQKAYYHSFPDNNPKDTEAFYAELVSRLEGDSQLTKAAALSALTSKLLALQLPSSAGVLDLNHNLLQLLASLSNQPLSSSLEVTPDVLDLLYGSKAAAGAGHGPAAGGPPAASGGASSFQRLLQGGAARKPAAGVSADWEAGSAASSSAEYDPYADDSSLSDWEGGGGSSEEQQEHKYRQQGQQEVSSQEDDDDECVEGDSASASHQQQQQQQPQDGGDRLAARMAALAAASRLGVAALPAGCIMPHSRQFVAKWAKVKARKQAQQAQQQQQPQRLLQQQQQPLVCVSQHFLTKQVLQVLQGAPAQAAFVIKGPADLSLSQQQPGPAPSAGSWQQPRQPRTGSYGYKGASSSSGCTSNIRSNASSVNGVSHSSQQVFEVDARVCTPYIAQSTLHASLREVAIVGTAARQLRALVQQLATSGTLGNTNVAVTPCMQALGVALQQQLDTLGYQLTELHQQSSQQQQQSEGVSRQERGGLLRFMGRAHPVMQRLRLLHDSLFGILQQLSGPPAAVSAGLVDGLAAAVEEAATSSGPQSTADAAALLHLLLTCCEPLSRALAQWLWSANDVMPAQEAGQSQAAGGSWAAADAPGQLQEQRRRWHAQQGGPSVCTQDFFVVRRADRDVSAVDPTFWRTAYALSRQQQQAPPPSRSAAAETANRVIALSNSIASSDGLCCSAVLAPFADSIMTAGKSMRLAQHVHVEEQEANFEHDRLAMLAEVAAARAAQQRASGFLGAPSQQQQGATGSNMLLQRQPSSSQIRRRPSSAGCMGGNSSSSNTINTAGRLSRQPSLTNSKPLGRPASAASASSKVVGAGGGSRKRWDNSASRRIVPTAPAMMTDADHAAAVISAVSKRTRLQLATAASTAGQQAHEELPHDFINTACFIMQQEQQLLQEGTRQVQQQQQQHLSQHVSGVQSGTGNSVTSIFWKRFEGIAGILAQPYDLAAAAAAQQGLSVVGGRQVGSLSQTLSAVAKGSHLQDGAAQPDGMERGAEAAAQHQQQQEAARDCTTAEGAACDAAQAPGGDGQPATAPTGEQQPSSTSATGAAAAAGAEADNSQAVAGADAATSEPPTTASADAAAFSTVLIGSSSASTSSSPDVLQLTAWRDQMEARLTAAGQQLRRMAPWQPHAADGKGSGSDGSSAGTDTQQQADAGSKRRQQQPRGKGKAASSTSSTSSSSSDGGGSWLLRAASTKAPGHFSGSLANLWPLKPIVGLNKALCGGGGDGDGGSSSSSSSAWLQGGTFPLHDLSWLLRHPPTCLPSVEHLLIAALVKPVTDRAQLVDHQLMSSLMGEWGMVAQLQGLVNVFLIASPGMVEWVDGLFTAVEARAKEKAESTRAGGGHVGCATPPSANKTAARTDGGGGAGAGVNSPGGLGGRAGGGSAAGVVAGGGPLRGLMHVTVEDLELSGLETLLHECVLAAGPDEVLPKPDLLVLTLNEPAVQAIRRAKTEQQAAAAQEHKQQQHGAGAGAGGVTRTTSSISGGGGSSVVPRYDVRATGGLALCSKEWLGLELQHAGSWQLSLLYNGEQLKTFSKVWQLMLQLRWVRRCVGAQAVAHRSSATVNDLEGRDRVEAAGVHAAVTSSINAGASNTTSSSTTTTSSSSSRGVLGGHSFGSSRHQAGGPAAGGGLFELMHWLTGKQELLLLQEMWHFLGCWQSFVLDGVRVKAWEQLEQVLLSAKDLDGVLTATSAFFSRMCSLCTMQPRANTAAALASTSIAALMDVALTAAAAAGLLQEARHKLHGLKKLQGREADMRIWWAQLAQARTSLRQAREQWRAQLTRLLDTWSAYKSRDITHPFEDLQDLLDMNGFFRRAACAPCVQPKAQTSSRQPR